MVMNKWHLRPATPGDAAALSVLAQETFCDTFNHYPPQDRAAHLSQYYTPHIFASQIASGDTKIWLAEAAGALIAYAQIGAYKLPLAAPVLPAVELYKLYVHRAWKGQKIGSAMMGKTFAIAEAQDAKAVYLGVWEGNMNAQQFYVRYGFKKIGEYDYPPIGRIVDREWIMMRELENKR